MQARQFYGETLGLRSPRRTAVLRLNLAAADQVLVYPKDDHEPAAFTVLNFPVDDIEAAVDGLAERGVEFEQYDDLTKTSVGSRPAPRRVRGSPGSRTRRATCSR